MAIDVLKVMRDVFTSVQFNKTSHQAQQKKLKKLYSKVSLQEMQFSQFSQSFMQPEVTIQMNNFYVALPISLSVPNSLALRQSFSTKNEKNRLFVSFFEKFYIQAFLKFKNCFFFKSAFRKFF